MKNLRSFSILFTLLTLTFTSCFQKKVSTPDKIEDTLNIKTIYPSIECPTEEARPVFSWTKLKTVRKNVKYRLVLVELEDKQEPSVAIEKNRKLVDEKGIQGTNSKLPAIAKDLRPNKVFAYQVSAYEGEKEKILAKSDIGLFYTLDNRLPEFFQDLICCEHNMLKKPIKEWKRTYGNPETDQRANGCFTSQGTIQLKGNQIGGDVVFQKLENENKVKKGNYYQISFCGKPSPKEMDYVRFRFLAFNGTLPSIGTHPKTAPNIAVIGESGDIKSKDWNRYFLSSWKAPKDYDHIAVLAITNENSLPDAQAIGSISNICMQMTDDCGLAAGELGFSEQGDVLGEAKNFITLGSKPEILEINYGLGSMVDMFGQPFNETGESNWYSLNDECIALGGEIPEEAQDLAEEYETIKLPGDISIETFNEGLNTYYEKYGKKMEFPKWGKIPEEKENDCRPNIDKSKPFSGRDIIYVHGLVLDHILKRTVANDQTGYLKSTANAVNFATDEVLDSVSKSWPQGNAEFFKDGFYHNMAKSYWDDHINHFLGSVDDPSNRYMLVAFNSSQRLIENVHTALTQISLAMNEGKGVVFGNDPRGPDCFGKEVVIISHSTGCLLMDVSLAIAQLSGEDDKTKEIFGDVQYIADRTKVHIALHGAIGGSELAALAVLGANMSAVAAAGTDIAVDVNIAVDNGIATGQQMVFDAITGLNTAGTTNNTDIVEAFMDAATDSVVVLTQNLAGTFNNSVLVDLSPHVAKLLWGNFINQNKVPVLTVAGGHPGGLSESLFTKWILPGFDDGVVSTNSQSGSPSLLHPELYLYIPPEERIFQKGIDVRRSNPYFAEQSKGVLGAAYGSVPFVAPSGMVQPVLAVTTPSPRYANHFPFLQSASEHMHSFFPNFEYASTFGAPNVEECLALENNFVFTNELVNPDISALVDRTIRGQDLVISFSIPYPIFDFWPPPPSVTWENYTFSIAIPIWRRTYDTLTGSDYETSFVYDFVLR